MTKRAIPLDDLYTTATKAKPKLKLDKDQLSLPPMAPPARCVDQPACKLDPAVTEVDVSFDFSGDGRRLLFSAYDSGSPGSCALSVLDFGSGAVIAKLFSGGWVASLGRQLSPKGDYVVLSGVARLEVIALATQKVVFTASYTINDFARFRFVGDHTLVFSSAEGLQSVDLETAKVVRKRALSDSAVMEIAPDGRRILLSASPRFAVWDATTGATVSLGTTCVGCTVKWTSDRYLHLAELSNGRPDVLFDVVTKKNLDAAPPDETLFSSGGFSVTRNLWDASLAVTTPAGKRVPLESTPDTPRFAVVEGRLFAQCWAWASVVEADGVAHSFPRTPYAAH